YINNFNHINLFKGKTLSIGGSLASNPFRGQSFTGDVSAIIMKNLPSWAEFKRAPKIETALLEHWDQKIARILKETADENITSFSGVPTWTLVLIQKMIEQEQVDSILDIWPNLELVAHGGVAFDPYRQLFKELIPNPELNYQEVYNASEGFFGIQDQPNLHELLLMLDYGIFYEFLPMEEYGKEFPQTVNLEDVVLGKNYALVISTNAGLWRYLIGDTVKFTSLSPFRIKISGRTKHFINAFGEEVIIENTDQSITKACEITGAKVSNYTAAPRYLEEGKKGGHEWVVEFEEEPQDLEKFIQVLDDTLREVNSDYDAKRQQDLALTRLVLHKASKGTFYKWMEARGKLGGQNKVPRLSNDRDYLEAILKLL
ncbi:GH3 auxin-responsive promoter family protein, partial [Cyclobacteriaceae bacterium]|nr:GH3 auxin-responsive promoter family protein [Cyclobacteriaceae bacterium]